MSKDDIDVETLIKAIEQRPAIWDKHSVDYAVRKKKKAAWDEICQIFFEDYNELPDNLRTHRSRMITNKWQNIRDNWIKCYKKINNLATKYGTKYKKGRKYIFYDQIKFLLPTMDGNSSMNCDSDLTNMNECNYDDDDEYVLGEQLDEKPVISSLVSIQLQNNDNNNRIKSSLKSNLKNESNSNSKESINELFTKKRSREEFDVKITDNLYTVDKTVNEDKSFLESLLPTLEKFDDDEKIEFRIEVLQVIKRIKSERSIVEVGKDPLESSNIF